MTNAPCDQGLPLDDPLRERFARTYAMHPEYRGNATRAYLHTTRSAEADALAANDRRYRSASVQGSRLLKEVGVRARVRALHTEAIRHAMARLRPWEELAVGAQETLRKAMTGQLRFPEADRKVEPELIRSALRSAMEILDRALGTSTQMHERESASQAIVVALAPPSGEAR